MQRWIGVLLAGVLLLGFVLTSCGGQGGGARAKARVVVSVAFPPRAQSSGSMLGLVPTGAPEAAEAATVKIYDANQSLVQTVTLTRNDPSASVTLNTGTYSFEVSVTDGQSPPLEVAWGEKTGVTISGDTTVALKVKSILRDLIFQTEGIPINANDSVNVGLTATSKSGSYFYRLPLGDLDSVSWQVSGGSLISGGKLGAEVAWNGSDSAIEVTAQAQGLGEDHQPTTVTKSVHIVPFTKAGDPLTVNGQFASWQGPDGARLVLADNHGQPALDLATVQSDGTFQAAFPSGNDLASHTNMLQQLDTLWSGCTNFSWTDAPEPAVVSTGHMLITTSSGQELAQVTIANASENEEGFFAYLDRDVSAQGSAVCFGMSITFDLQAQAGWNWVVQQIDQRSGQGTITMRPATPNPYSVPDGFVWLADVRYADLKLTAPNTSFSPTVGQDFQVQLVVENRAGTDAVDFKVQLDFDDAKLSVVSVSSSPDLSPSYNPDDKAIYFTSNLGVGDSVAVTLTLRAASGTEGSSLSLGATVENIGPPEDIDPSNNSVTITITPQQASSPANVGLALDMDPPVVSFASPSDGATLDRNASPVVVQLEANDNVGVSNLEIYNGFQLLGSLNSGDVQYDSDLQRYLYNWDVSALSSGAYRLTAVAYDAAGNSGTANIQVTLQ